MRESACKAALLMAGMACVAGLRPASASAPSAGELEVKAAMIYNFVKFVEWPKAPASMPFVMGVSGSGPFAAVLARTVTERSVNGRPVVVRQVHSPAEIQSCHLLFVAGADAARVGAAIDAARRSAVLTIGESSGFARRGGIIGFVIVDNRTNFEINAEAAQRSGLKVSSKLLRLATVVKE